MNIYSFTDNLDIVDQKPIVVRATMSMVPTDKGGRVGPFTNGFRPNHNFGSQDNRFFYIGQIEVPEGEWVYPGESRELEVTFLNARGLTDLLRPGRTWRIQEGTKLIATATLIATA
jgi:elongation factor Tu